MRIVTINVPKRAQRTLKAAAKIVGADSIESFASWIEAAPAIKVADLVIVDPTDSDADPSSLAVAHNCLRILRRLAIPAILYTGAAPGLLPGEYTLVPRQAGLPELTTAIENCKRTGSHA